jgi:hypothetical protein
MFEIASLIISNKELFSGNRMDIKLGNLTPPMYAPLDMPENQDPNHTYPNTTWIQVNDHIHFERDLPPEGGEPGELATVGFKMWIRTK